MHIKVPAKLRQEDNAVRLVKRYLADDPRTGRPRNAGVYFDRLGGGGDQPETAHQITAVDLVAVSMLGVQVDRRHALHILDYRASEIGDLLAQLPPDVKLTDDGAAGLIAEGAPAWQLWELLRAVNPRTDGRRRLGHVAASKLLARKRPHLIPVYDSHVKGALGRPAKDYTWWSELRRHLAADDYALARELETVRTRAGADHLSLLRTLDVMCWMYDRS